MIGASYGAGNYGMSGRAYDPRFVFSWPNHRIAVMGPEQLAGRALHRAPAGGRARGPQPFDEDADAEAPQSWSQQQIEKESYAFFATARVWDDGIIDPRDSRSGARHRALRRSLRCRRGDVAVRRLPHVRGVG